MADTFETADAGYLDNLKFAFGRNWARFLSTVDEARVSAAQQSLQTLLRTASLRQRTFLDAGSGSGLFSLAASRLGADVTSFDVDRDCVACTEEIKRRFQRDATNWKILHGSLSDVAFLQSLGRFDIVYCWGVAHHTGNMWNALDNLVQLVSPKGCLVLAIYNDQLYISRAWRGVKRLYQRLPRVFRPLLVLAIGAVELLKRAAVTLAACLLRLVTLRNPFVPVVNWVSESHYRGMHSWYDLVDWVGGWPFEVARPEDVFRFMRDRGFSLQELVTSDGHGCNEFVFVRESKDVGDR